MEAIIRNWQLIKKDMDVNEHERISIITLNVFRTFFINNLKDKTDT